MLGEIEDCFGARLFERSHQGIHANALGTKRGLPGARGDLNELARGHGGRRRHAKRRTAVLRVGAPSVTAAVPAAIVELRRRMPGAAVQLPRLHSRSATWISSARLALPQCPSSSSTLASRWRTVFTWMPMLRRQSWRSGCSRNNQQRRRQPEPRFWSCAHERADGRVQEGLQAAWSCVSNSTEYSAISFCPTMLAAHADAPQHRQRTAQRRVQRGHSAGVRTGRDSTPR
jgi:hypothetical protein